MPVSALVRTRNSAASDCLQVARKRTDFPRYGTAWNRAVRHGRTAVALLCAALVVAGCSRNDDASSIVRTTTNIAGAGVVGLERDTAHACPLPSAPDPSNGKTRTVTHAAGTSEVPADPQRIVVLSTSALDAACAVGLWERVVGAVPIDGPRPQPVYLGYGVLKIPAVGSAAQPDFGQIAGLHPDLIIGDNSSGAAGFAALQAIAPTVLADPASGWQAEFRTLAAGLGRSNAAATALENYRTEARDTGNTLAASQSQASVLRFTADKDQVQGSDSFAGQILADAGVQRPTAQRGTSFEVTEPDLIKVEGDIIYVIFAGEAGEERGKKVLHSDAWLDLGAAADKRVFAVEDTVWHGDGLTAARALLADLRNSLNGYVTD
ncbi:iron-siderophore ABC transporter substrate-binding protein [Nocardia sp. NBC_00565]|uniref:iron-siderophore ABC transporter substrate-binding protein n=1 Tax=Nocardia sp. NBC_00565 TaxID=2975993 RepID=UPI002E813E50|nr:iron-siderophore ABC transporter substrate-binding protein [Nocardia sp. NBC_00565]WUC00197.1 iron-siderophore ABC transporter substrate-binding protein [Nocardia sp. NBC_00565]